MIFLKKGKNMKKKVLGISTSPRKNGNSDLLLKKALKGAESMGAKVEYINLNDYKLNPCIECNSCYITGKCVIKDDYQELLEKLLNTERLIFATPVFFMSVCAQAKMLIDRGQCLWAKKYILKQEIITPPRDRRAMVIAVGGSKSTKQFECIRWTFKSYFDSLDIRYVSGLFVGKVDESGAIEKHPIAFDEAYKLGSSLTADTPPAEKPTNIELIAS
jgi:multimeric flavodoxin WrbA